LPVSSLNDDRQTQAFLDDLSTCSELQLDSAFVPLELFHPRASGSFDIAEGSIIALRPRPVLRLIFAGSRNGWCAQALLGQVQARTLFLARVQHQPLQSSTRFCLRLLPLP